MKTDDAATRDQGLTQLQREALRHAHHDLVTLGNLTVCDGAAPAETWKTDTVEAILLLEAAFPSQFASPGICPLCGH